MRFVSTAPSSSGVIPVRREIETPEFSANGSGAEMSTMRGRFALRAAGAPHIGSIVRWDVTEMRRALGMSRGRGGCC